MVLITLLNILIIILDVMILFYQANIKKLLRHNKNLLNEINKSQFVIRFNEAMRNGDMENAVRISEEMKQWEENRDE